MIKIRRDIYNYLVCLMIILTVFTFTITSVSAGFVGDVLKSWDKYNGPGSSWTENRVYTSISCTNGYTYTQHSKNTTTFALALADITRFHYWRNYTTY